MPYDPETDGPEVDKAALEGKTHEEVLSMKREQELGYYTGMELNMGVKGLTPRLAHGNLDLF